VAHVISAASGQAPIKPHLKIFKQCLKSAAAQQNAFQVNMLEYMNSFPGATPARTLLCSGKPRLASRAQMI
jgi:hypothetical protein